MSTATTWLRRAGAGGLAAAVIAGSLIAGAGSALAWSGGTVAATGGTTSLPQGATTAASDLVATLPTAWNVGDTITFQIANPNNCTTTTNAAYWTAAAPSFAWPTGYTVKTGDVLPAVTPTLSESTACAALTGTQVDKITLTFNNSGNNATGGTPILTIKHSVAVGTTVPVGPLSVSVTPAGSGTVPAASTVVVGTVTNALVSATAVAAQPSVKITSPTISVKEAVPAVMSGTVTFTFSGATVDPASVTGTSATAKATWSGGGTLTLAAPTATTVTVAGLVATSSAAGTLTLSGVKITPAAVTNGITTPPGGAGVLVKVVPSGGVVVGTTPGIFGTSTTPSATLAADVNMMNTGGSDRYFTAKALFDAFVKGGGKTTSVVLASGANYPDALSANTLAGALGVGVLLTDPSSLSTAASLAIAGNKIPTVYILGGTGAVSAKVEAQVKALSWVSGTTTVNPTVVRLGGADRYATNNLVDIFAKSAGTLTTTAFVATGGAFADALAIGPEVIDTQNPLVLTSTTALSASAQASLIDLGIKNVVILGGTGAVSADVEKAINNLGITVLYRLAGTDRTQTAQQIATWATAVSPATGVPATTTYPTPPSGLGFSLTTVHVANGANFPDALAAAQFAGQQGQVILLSNSPTSAGIGGPAFIASLADNGDNVGTVNGLGLSGAVSQSVLNAFALGILG